MNNPIPTDWKQVKLGELIEIKHGFAFSSQFFSERGDFILLTPGNFYEEGGFKFRGEKDRFYTGEFPKQYLLNKGDVIIAMTEQKEGLLGSAAIIPDSNRFLHNQRLGLVEIKKNCIKEFLFFAFKTKRFRSEISATASGTKVRHTSPTKIQDTTIKVPPIPEQHRIVTILETWDKSIEKLTRKIELKKNIKKGLMQELLTGKRRLKGFNDEWRNYELGEVLGYEQPQKYIVDSDQYDDLNKTPVLTAGKSFILGYTNETDGICTNLPVIIFDDFTTANKFVDFEFKVKSSAMKLLRSKDNSKFNIKFIYERMQLVNFIVGEHKRKYLSEYQYLTIKLPDIEEQTAIAQILTTVDEEITALEKKKQILEDQKKYLLNNLITGQIRTPENLTMPKQ